MEKQNAVIFHAIKNMLITISVLPNRCAFEEGSIRFLLSVLQLPLLSYGDVGVVEGTWPLVLFWTTGCTKYYRCN